MINIKGSRWIAVNEYFAKVAGPEAFQKILTAMSEADKLIFQKTILPLSWIDYSAYLRWVFTADKVLGKGDNKLVEGSSIYTAQTHFRGIYKMFIQVVSPSFLLSRVSKIWQQYVDRGNLAMQSISEKHVQLLLTDIPDIPLHHDLSHNPFYEETLRISGAKNPKVTHPKCFARGDNHCLWDITWE